MDSDFKQTENDEILTARFARHVAICHTALPIVGELGGDEVVYEAQSPDESALLNGLKSAHIKVLSRTKSEIKIKVGNREETLEILHVLEFTSDRKRMSVIVLHPDGPQLFCKGADQMIFDRLAPTLANVDHRAETQSIIEAFSNQGLRTLVFAFKQFSLDEYEKFRGEFESAERSLVDREANIYKACELAENNMTLLGASAIEDKLQDRVPETIDFLLKCGIKIWLLTGDKRETAVNISMSSKLLSPKMNIMTFECESQDSESVRAQLASFIALAKKNAGRKNGLVITGDYLSTLVSDHGDMLLELTEMCASVLCCRVSPLQKATAVQLVRKKLNKITLSVGDGANDVSMIQAANVGVGIAGMEGAQAVRASDFSIPQFQCLQRLITVHGRYSNYRTSSLIFYSLYKNMMFISVCFWFGFYSAWSGIVRSPPPSPILTHFSSKYTKRTGLHSTTWCSPHSRLLRLLSLKKMWMKRVCKSIQNSTNSPSEAAFSRHLSLCALLPRLYGTLSPSSSCCVHISERVPWVAAMDWCRATGFRHGSLVH